MAENNEALCGWRGVCARLNFVRRWLS